MCGIAGVVAWDDRRRVDRQMLSRMAAAVEHRGPDGCEVWINHEEEVREGKAQCGLGFCRLAILDLDRRAMQPMTDGRRWLAFNGEIYNFRELRGELDSLRPGYFWKTSGDSEVILRAFDAWGEACVEHFNGMFAFAIWEPEGQSLFLARDRMGQKPLYVAASDGGVAFGSELEALRGLPWVDWAVNAGAVAEYLRTGYIAAPETIYRGVMKLEPASWMRCGADGRITRRYFDANGIGGGFGSEKTPTPALPRSTRGGSKRGEGTKYPEGEAASGNVGVKDIKSAVMAAVRRQLVADVPVGCFLSGGIDSSVVAWAMKSGEQRALTFSIGFDDPRYDETEYAAAVAKHLGTEHRQFIVRADAAEDLPKLARVFGEPFGDSSALPTHYLSRETRACVKVALSGDGGDELFGGYDRYRAMRWGMGGAALRGEKMWNKLAGLLPGGHPKSALSRAKRFVAAMGLPEAKRYAAYVALCDDEWARALYPRGEELGRRLVEDAFTKLRGGRDAVAAALATDRVTYLPEDLLAKLDRASMLHGLEVRSPFMDHELVHLAARLTRGQLLKGGAKRMLREAFAAELPEFVFRRKKMGFAVPIGQWLRTSLRPMMCDLLGAADSFAAGNFERSAWERMIEEHQSGRVDHSQRLYALVMLELWWRQGK